MKHKVFWIECDAASGEAGDDGDDDVSGSDTAGGTGGTGGAFLGGQGGPRGGVAGGQGGPGGGSLPNTAVPVELAGSLGGLLLVLSGIAYTANRRRVS